MTANEQLDAANKTIVELRDEVKIITSVCELNQGYVHDLAKSNQKLMDAYFLMLSALNDALEFVYQITYMVADGQFMNCDVCDLGNKAIVTMSNTIAQVESLTVSKQGVSTESEDDCEQTVEESKNPSMVARQNTPNEPTEHNYQLAQHNLAKEVETDMRMRGELT